MQNRHRIFNGLISILLAGVVAGCSDQPKDLVIGTWKSETGRLLIFTDEGRLMTWELEADKNSKPKRYTIITDDGSVVRWELGVDRAMRGDFEWRGSRKIEFSPEVKIDGNLIVLDGNEFSFTFTFLSKDKMKIDEHNADETLVASFAVNRIDYSSLMIEKRIVGQWKSAPQIPIEKRFIQQMFQSKVGDDGMSPIGGKLNAIEPKAEHLIFKSNGTLKIVPVADGPHADESGTVGYYWCIEDDKLKVYFGWPPELSVYSFKFDDDGQLFLGDKGPYSQ